MHSLHEFQAAFAAAIFEQDPSAIDGTLCGDNTQDRLAVYIGNTYHNLREALRAVYPVVDRLVGEPFFDYAANRYIRDHPSQSGDIQRFGDSFPAFLESFPPAVSLSYLADTATLEWLVHEVFHAADHAPLPLSELSSLAGAECSTLRLRLHPACRLFASAFPVRKIWEVNQRESLSNETINARAGGERLLVRRVGFAVDIQPLPDGEFAMLRALHEGQTVDDAYDLALRRDPAFALGEFIERRILDSTIVGFDL
ncbi:putative DNA-binding domain-containing protein [Paraburkholderia sp. LEh10]|uniref:HvfC/BufC N-terminal domain-containing protein n=1 Tax=Paraburkholderia sp. LEh10 TaxID=2821353 RepID=UPI001AEB00F4|nr:DNA-binding domain-containing protein [Paraburkholderia sp. LEh10]MBP0590789.1 putative DNA-binding domain-containing protein [Paraburkholderia sp. LEh10]